jgi:hypothetical protein
MQIGVGFPFFKQQLHLPSPFVGTIDHVEAIARRREVGQQVTELLRPAIPADEQTQAEGMLLQLPDHHKFDPLTLGEFGVDHLEWLVTQRTQS